MITVHHLENSQSIRILWLLEELGADYKIQHYKRVGPQTLAPSEYKKLHPLGKSPTITDGDLVLAETNAIMDYILDQFPDSPLRPRPGTPERTRYLYWLHATQGSFMPLLLDTLIFKRFISKSPFFLRPIMKAVIGRAREAYLKPNMDKMLAYIDAELGQSTWLAGEQLTAADIVMGYCLSVAEVRVGLTDEHANIRRFLTQMRERPVYKAALVKNGPFNPLSG